MLWRKNPKGSKGWLSGAGFDNLTNNSEKNRNYAEDILALRYFQSKFGEFSATLLFFSCQVAAAAFCFCYCPPAPPCITVPEACCNANGIAFIAQKCEKVALSKWAAMDGRFARSVQRRREEEERGMTNWAVVAAMSVYTR